MGKLLSVSLSPCVRSHETTHSTTLGVVIAILLATAFGVYHFNVHVLLAFIVMVAARVLSEYVCERLMKKPSTINDYSALVTGLTLALDVPPEIPVWIPALDGIFATIVVKQLCGSLEQNFTNPIPAARRFPLISFAREITNFSHSGFDGVSGAILLAVLKSGRVVDVLAMSAGNILDTIGEIFVVVLLIGVTHLLAKKVIPIWIPGTYVLAVAVFAILLEGHGSDSGYVAAYLRGGGLTLGAFPMAANYVTSPIAPKGQTMFGILLGVFTGLFRIFGDSAEGVPYVIIISDTIIPLIEKVTLPRASGKEGK